MTRISLLAAVLFTAVATVALSATPAEATIMDARARRQASQYPWHGAYYHVNYGQPLALVVPPNAGSQTHYGWGVGSFRSTPIHFQFGRAYAPPGPSPGLSAPPYWPSDTSQFGVYYIRGPW